MFVQILTSHRFNTMNMGIYLLLLQKVLNHFEFILYVVISDIPKCSMIYQTKKESSKSINNKRRNRVTNMQKETYRRIDNVQLFLTVENKVINILMHVTYEYMVLV